MNQNEFIQYVSNCTEVFYDEPEPEAALIFARALLARAEAAEAEAARLRNELAAMTDDRDQWQAAYADNELYGLAVMQRRDELEAEAPRLRDEVRSLTPRPSYEAMAARVAELEAQLAAQGWRPGSETPKHDWYLVYDFSEDDQPLVRFYGPAGWQLSGDRVIPNWYMSIPPLPPAPQETE